VTGPLSRYNADSYAQAQTASPSPENGYTPGAVESRPDGPSPEQEAFYGSPTLLTRGSESADLSQVESHDSLAESDSHANVFDRLYNQAVQQQARAQERVKDAETQERNSVQPVSPIKVPRPRSP
jgi:hypothetical protein